MRCDLGGILTKCWINQVVLHIPDPKPNVDLKKDQVWGMEVEVVGLAVEVAKGCRRLFVYINHLFTKGTGKLRKSDQGLKDWLNRQAPLLAGTLASTVGSDQAELRHSL